MILDFFMAKMYKHSQRSDQKIPPQITQNQNTQCQKTQSLNIPQTKKHQNQNTQGQDTQNWNNDTNWITKSILSPKVWK